MISPFQAKKLTLSPHWSYNLTGDPKRFAFVLSRYKFVGEMISQYAHKKIKILELGCSEGIGLPLLTQNATEYLGIDLDNEAIDYARKNWKNNNINFECCNFLQIKLDRTFDVVLSLDVVEHIEPEFENQYFSTIVENMSKEGIVFVGTPNVTSAPYASEASQVGHVNLFDQKRLQETMENYFRKIFIFALNDEVVHTGYAPMSHYIMAVGVGKK